MSTTPWVTLDEGAEHIRAKSTRLIRDAIKAGDLASYRYGKGEIRLKVADLDAWLESRPYEPPAAAS